MPRFLLPPETWDQAILTGDEARHASQVLRLKPGKEIVVFDGKGRRAAAEITQISRDKVSLSMGETLASPVLSPAITLLQAIPKGKNMELIVQKAVELGVSTIIPVITQNTVVQPGDGKADKWRRIALEACKQCGQDTLPTISEPKTFNNCLDHNDSCNSLKIIASLQKNSEPLKKILRVSERMKEVSLLIGPEGDFTCPETEAALRAGFQPASLGDIVLRVETASLFCLSAIRYEFDDLS
ncbi:16S rRNA (uracil(1498)-N(3))-methyltransferase [Luteolibacter pohnpeiensis]|uniref:Ribosomal RNA small subunit methyltransferase E n=1 Tax=Luteolibacter pohnpeiensis TaxID=454153 RepID=A0A934VWK4_9BACT|nr:16S rRNA (uracil(1498)-N(3))-methyltransferase [Luteolibacter pohnpeiensis]MBK1882908.1 16S rRNA (uracil(1498)-N(3))-methyltransferase [Luteolibacter pohnpeiensis]